MLWSGVPYVAFAGDIKRQMDVFSYKVNQAKKVNLPWPDGHQRVRQPEGG